MRVAYLYEYDAADINVQSGHPAAILHQLRNLGHEVIPVYPLSRGYARRYWPIRAAFAATGKIYRPDREPGYLRAIARQAECRLKDVSYDVAFAPGSHLAAEVQLERPLVFCADASFASVVDRYPEFSGCAERFQRLGHRQDRKALARCSAAIYPSVSAVQEAQRAYGVDPSKLHMIPFGANVDVLPIPLVRAAIRARTGRPLRILFIGRDWVRKGGDLVVAACAQLADKGLPIRLDIVGPQRRPSDLPNFVAYHGFLDKKVAADRQRLNELLLGADLFFMPSRAEAYGMALCEALACGVPVLSTAVGGIPSIVRNGVNGFVLPLTAGPEQFASIIESRFVADVPRRHLSDAALSDFHERLSWDRFGAACEAVLAAVCCNGPNFEALRHGRRIIQ